MKLYKLIYLCCLLINSTDITSTEINIVDHLGITEENQKLITDIKPAEVIKDKIDIDMDFLIHSKIGFSSCLILFTMIILNILLFSENNIIMKISENYINEYNQIIERIYSFFLKLIIIPIISYIVIIVLDIKKYIKHNSLFKSWFIYMFILLISIVFTIKGWTDWKDPESDKTTTIPQDIYNIFNIFGAPGSISPGIQGIRSIVAILFVNNLILITTYYIFKGYYHLRPMKYKEKRDYINSLKNINNISPIQVLDNDLDKNLILTNNNQ
jgi:hypothetical protein